jgi:hypothetical protein
MRQTTPFNVCLRLGGEEYTVRFESLPVIHATLGNFEAELMNAVPIKYKELLHLNFAAGYKLRIRRLLHTATAVFDSEEIVTSTSSGSGWTPELRQFSSALRNRGAPWMGRSVDTWLRASSDL